MKAKILTALKNKYANLGLSEQTMEGAAGLIAGFVKDEAEIEGAISGAEPMMRQIQSEADKRANSYKSEGERLKAEIAEAKKKLEELSKTQGQEPSKNDDTPQWAKDLMAKVGTLEVGLNNFNAERTSQSLMQKVSGLLTEKKVPESFYAHSLAGRTFKEEAEVASFTENIVKAYGDFKQNAANLGFNYVEPPQNGSSSVSEADEVAALIAADTKKLAEAQQKK